MNPQAQSRVDMDLVRVSSTGHWRLNAAESLCNVHEYNEKVTLPYYFEPRKEKSEQELNAYSVLSKPKWRASNSSFQSRDFGVTHAFKIYMGPARYRCVKLL